MYAYKTTFFLFNDNVGHIPRQRSTKRGDNGVAGTEKKKIYRPK